MPGNDNGVYYGTGFRIDESDARSIGNMQKNATCESLINYSGDPEGNVSANTGSMTYDRTNGTSYIKRTGTGTTGWERIQQGNTGLTNYTDGIGSSNLGLFYSSPVATIKGADGNDLSESNPGFLTIRSNVTPGKLITYKMTSNFTFQDAGGTSVFAGSLFGMSTGDTTTDERAIVFYLYAVGNATDTDFTFIVNRYPAVSSSVNGSGQTLKDAGSGEADTFANTMALEVLGGSLSSFSGTRATNIGSFSANINGSNDWVINAVAGTVGIGKFNGLNNRVHSRGIMGQAANSYFLANGGTPPTAATANEYLYRIDSDNATLSITLATTFGGNPSGAVDAIINVPIVGPSATIPITLRGTLVVVGNTYVVTLVRVGSTYGTTNRQFYLQKGEGTTARWQYEEFSNGDILLISDTVMLN